MSEIELPCTPNDLSSHVITLRHYVDEFVGLAHVSEPLARARYNKVIALIHGMCACLDEAEAEGVDSSLLAALVKPVVDIQRASPFIRRIHEWPRGYPGDFETIEYILEGFNRAPPDTLAYLCEQYALNSAPVYQHRNKILLQQQKLEQIASSTPNARVLVVAAGGGADLRDARDVLVATGAIVVVNDADPDAIELCQTRLDSLHAHYVCGNVFDVMPSLRALGPYDLILAGGLFDYVPTAHLRRLLRKFSSALKDGGQLMFSNIAAGNPYRSSMRYFASWALIERTAEEVRQLASCLGDGVATRIGRDLSGLSWIIECYKQNHR